MMARAFLRLCAFATVLFGAARRAAATVTKSTPGPTNIDAEKVFVVFSNHLDIGYDVAFSAPNEGMAADILSKYINEYLPTAVETASRFTANATDVRRGRSYTWMGHSYLIEVLLHCNETTINVVPGTASRLVCPAPAAVAALEAALRAGPRAGITWHAFPHNSEPEMLTPELFHAAVAMSHRLDDRYNRSRRITYSQRDVPGLTRASLPLLAKHGVRAVSVGENFAPRPLAFFDGDQDKEVPTKIFRWLDRGSGTSALAFFHPKGYGGTGLDDCVYVAAARTALCTDWKLDNTGPHSYDEASAVFDKVQAQFPNAKVVASDGFDDFVRTVLPVLHTLPVLDREIGDSWIYGASADPVKVSAYRAAARARARCIADGRWATDGAAEATFDRLLLKVSEHTWGSAGGDCKTLPFDTPLAQLGAYPRYAGSVQGDGGFDPMCVNTWYEQRGFVTNAVRAVVDSDGDGGCGSELEAEMQAISPTWRAGLWTVPPHSPAGFAAVPVPDPEPYPKGEPLSVNESVPAAVAAGVAAIGGADHAAGGGRHALRFNEHGGIVAIGVDAAGEADPMWSRWCNSDNPLAQFEYQVVSGGDMIKWVSAYSYLSSPDFSNFATGGAEATSGGSIGATGYAASAGLGAAWQRDTAGGGLQVLLNLSMPAKGAEAGAPDALSVLYTVRHGRQRGGRDTGAKLVVDLELRTIGKRPTKHKEAGWVGFTPPIPPGSLVELNKLGRWVNPTDVLPFNGSSMHLHAVHTGVRWTAPDGARLTLETFDAALVSVGDPNPAPTAAVDGDPRYKGRFGTVPDPSRGVWVSCFNNIWNTNYPFWYPWQTEDANTKYRFRLTLEAPPDPLPAVTAVLQ